MALSLSDIVKKKSDKPPKIVIYGPGGVGKTSLAAEFPNSIFIQTEDGGGDLEITSFSQDALTEYFQVKEALGALASEDHEFMTLIIDSLTSLEPLIWAAVCQDKGWKSIEEPDFGKGYLEADSYWHKINKACTWLRDNKNMTILLLAHETIVSYPDPTSETYERYQMRLHKRGEAIIREDSDAVFFMNQVVTTKEEKSGFNKKVFKGSGSGQRAIYTSERPGFRAKTRYEMPHQILVNKGEGYAALAPYLPGHRSTVVTEAAA